MQGGQGRQVLSSLADRIIQDSESDVQADQVEPVGKIRYRVVVVVEFFASWNGVVMMANQLRQQLTTAVAVVMMLLTRNKRGNYVYILPSYSMF